MLYTVLLILIPYAVFLAFAKQINPWSKPDDISRVPPWRRGRRIGFLLFQAIAIYLVISLDIHESFFEAAILVSAVITLTLVLALIDALYEKTVEKITLAHTVASIKALFEKAVNAFRY